MSKQKKPKYPQFSLTWLYLIIAIVLGFLILNGGSGSLLDGGSKEVTYIRFCLAEPHAKYHYWSKATSIKRFQDYMDAHGIYLTD